MKISEEQAKQIHEVFGPCTFLYECGDTEEIIAQGEENETIKDLLDSLFESESLHLEQRGNQWSGEDEEQFKKDVASDKQFLAGLRKRIDDYIRKDAFAPKPWFPATGWVGEGTPQHARVICRVEGYPYGDTVQRLNLLASAKELLAELKRFRDAAQSWHDFHKHTPDLIQCDELCARIKPATELIAKAERSS